MGIACSHPPPPLIELHSPNSKVLIPPIYATPRTTRPKRYDCSFPSLDSEASSTPPPAYHPMRQRRPSRGPPPRYGDPRRGSFMDEEVLNTGVDTPPFVPMMGRRGGGIPGQTGMMRGGGTGAERMPAMMDRGRVGESMEYYGRPGGGVLGGGFSGPGPGIPGGMGMSQQMGMQPNMPMYGQAGPGLGGGCLNSEAVNRDPALGLQQQQAALPRRQAPLRDQDPMMIKAIPQGAYIKPTGAHHAPPNSPRSPLVPKPHPVFSKPNKTGNEFIPGDEFLDACRCNTDCTCRQGAHRAMYRSKTEDGKTQQGFIRYELPESIGRNCDDHADCIPVKSGRKGKRGRGGASGGEESACAKLAGGLKASNRRTQQKLAELEGMIREFHELAMEGGVPCPPGSQPGMTNQMMRPTRGMPSGMMNPAMAGALGPPRRNGRMPLRPSDFGKEDEGMARFPGEMDMDMSSDLDMGMPIPGRSRGARPGHGTGRRGLPGGRGIGPGMDLVGGLYGDPVGVGHRGMGRGKRPLHRRLGPDTEFNEGSEIMMHGGRSGLPGRGHPGPIDDEDDWEDDDGFDDGGGRPETPGRGLGGARRGGGRPGSMGRYFTAMSSKGPGGKNRQPHVEDDDDDGEE